MDRPAQDSHDTPSLPPLPSFSPHGETTDLPAAENSPGSGRPPHPVSASIPRENLLDDKLILAAPRIEFEGRGVPALGGIALLAKLGQGGMGAVYHGYHPRLRKEVAVKVLPFHLAQTRPHLLQRFAREAQIAAQIQSPHLVAVTDVNQESGLSYLVMELVSGQSARQFLETTQKSGRKSLDEATALDICIAACEGLAAAHAKGIIHRDIKPDNILLPFSAVAGALSPGRQTSLDIHAAKLADLGLARSEAIEQSLTGSMDVMGTPGFLAPEQAIDAKGVGKPADVFGMGATLYALLSGGPPFTGETTVQVVFATMNKAHTPLMRVNPRVSRPTATLVDHCLTKNPLKRYADGAVLSEALRICREALGGSDAQQTQAINQLVNLLHSLGAGAVKNTAKGAGSSAIAINPRRMNDDAELDRILRDRPKMNSAFSDPDSLRRLRFVVPAIMMVMGFAFWLYATRGGSLGGGFVSPRALPYFEPQQVAEKAREKGRDPALIDEAIGDVRDVIARYKDHPDADLEPAQFALQELQMRKAGKRPDGSLLPGEKEDPKVRVVKKEAPKPLQVTQEGDEDGRLITRVYSPLQERNLGPGLRQIACSPSGRELYAIYHDKAVIRIFDPATLESTGEIQAAKNPVGIWCDERRIIAACDLSQVFAVFDAFTHAPLASVAWPAEPALRPVRIIGPAPDGSLLSVWRKSGEERDSQRVLAKISETGAVTRIVNGQIDWGVFLPDGKRFIGQGMPDSSYSSPSSKNTFIYDLTTGKTDTRIAMDLFKPGYGFNAGFAHTFWTADRRHLVISTSHIEYRHGFQAWTYLATPDLRHLEIDYPGVTVAELPEQGLLVSWGTVVEQNVHKSHQPPDIFYVSRSTGRIVRRVTIKDFFDSDRNLHTTISADRNTLYVPRHELMLTFKPGRTGSSKLLVIRCGPVDPDKRVPADPNLVVSNAPPAEIKAGQPFAFTPQFEFMPPLKIAPGAKSPAIEFKLKESPPGIAVDPKTGRLDWTPGPASIGLFDLKLVAQIDGQREAPVLRCSIRVKP